MKNSSGPYHMSQLKISYKATVHDCLDCGLFTVAVLQLFIVAIHNIYISAIVAHER